MKQTIIYTTLPNGRRVVDGNHYLHMSLHCSMRLSHTSETTIQMFPDIIRWAQKIKEAEEFSVKWNGSEPSDAVADTAAIDPHIWETLVHPEVKVSAFIVEDKTKSKIHTYPIKEISDTILNIYKNFGIASPSRLIKPRDFLRHINQINPGRFSVDQQVINTWSQAADISVSRPVVRNSFRRLDIDQDRVIRKNVQSPLMEQYRQTMIRGDYAVLRKRNLEPEFQFTRFRDFHHLDLIAGKVADEEVPVPEFEFHDILAQMGDYPQMQRRLGLVVDLQVPLPAGIPAEGVVSAWPRGLTFEGETEISVTSTACRITGSGFFARERPGEETDFHNGFVKLNTPAFSVTQIDTDSAAIQTINQADTHLVRIAESTLSLRSRFLRMTPDEEKVDDEDDEKAVDDEQEEGLPVIRSAGICIVKNHVEEYLNKKFIKSLDLNLKLATPVRLSEPAVLRNRNLLGITAPLPALTIMMPDTEVLYANDLIAGYRLDIALSDAPGKWYSLHCKQDEITCFDQDMNPVAVEGITPDEGFCQIAMTGKKDDDDELFVSGVIARWTGWSLAVERPGFPIDEAEDDEGRDHVTKLTPREEDEQWSAPDTNIRMNVRTRLVPGTLPGLRYGRSYNLRMRYVDIAGNSVPPESEPDRPHEAIIRNFTYLRYEPAGSPPVLQASALKSGEDIERLVIKSNAGISAQDYDGADVTEAGRIPQRILVPPQVNQLMAEHHGKFEQAFTGDAGAARKIYELITSRETPPGAGEPQDKIWSAGTFTVRYLPDPAAAGVAFFLADGYDETHTQEFKPHHIRFIPSGKGSGTGGWLNPIPVTIRLLEGDVNSHWDGKSLLTFYLPKGHKAKIRYSCFWEPGNLEKFSGIRYHLSQERGFAAVRNYLENGRHWMVSPSREIELVHAVQQPLIEPELQDTLSDRGFLDTPSWIRMKIRVHGQSTGKVDIEAAWEEWDDDPLKPLPEKITSGELLDPVQVSYKDQLKHVGYVPPKNPEFSVVNLNPPLLRPSPVMTRSGPVARTPVMTQRMVTTTNLRTMSLISSFTPAFVVRTWGLMHGFSDTRHRVVDYKPVASSRYAEYFRQPGGDGTPEYPEGLEITRTGKAARVNILSSARPLPPEVEYIIPTFNWHKSGEKDRQTHIRRGGGLRIYMRRPWFSSGEGEMLAAVLHGGGLMLPPSVDDKVHYSQWGTDPIRPFPGGKDLYLSESNFRWFTGQEKGLEYPGLEKGRANVVVFPVKFDAERKLWYTDLTINPGNRYFPFVKLMLARYQQQSIRIGQSDVCLSPVVETDFIQLLPERKVEVLVERRSGRASRIQMHISGSRYQAFNNIFEINIISEDIPQPVSGIISDAVPKRRARGQQAQISEIRYPDEHSFVAYGYFDISKELRDFPFNIVVLEYEKAFADDDRRLVFSDEFYCWL